MRFENGLDFIIIKIILTHRLTVIRILEGEIKSKIKESGAEYLQYFCCV